MAVKQEAVLRVSVANMVINTVLMCVKAAVGWLCGSQALVSDAVHSMVDVFSSMAVMIGVKLSARRSDAGHPYGYERMECVAAVILAILVGVTGVGIGMSGVRSMLSAANGGTAIPGGAALITAGGAVVVKEVMFHYTRRTAKKASSGALMADAWHIRADVLSSLGGFIGVLGANLGVPALDPAAAVLISLFILKAAVTIFVDAMRKMTDRACDEELQNNIAERVLAQDGVHCIDEMKTRLFGNHVYVEVTIGIDGGLSSKEAYEIAQAVHSAVEREFEAVKGCAVHIHPL